MNCNYNMPYEPTLANSNGNSSSSGGGRLELEFTYLTFGEFHTIFVGTLPADKSIFKIQMQVIEGFDNLEIVVKETTNNTAFSHFEKDEMMFINDYFIMSDNVFPSERAIILQKVNSTISTGRAKIILYYL